MDTTIRCRYRSPIRRALGAEWETRSAPMLLSILFLLTTLASSQLYTGSILRPT